MGLAVHPTFAFSGHVVHPLSRVAVSPSCDWGQACRGCSGEEEGGAGQEREEARMCSRLIPEPGAELQIPQPWPGTRAPNGSWLWGAPSFPCGGAPVGQGQLSKEGGRREPLEEATLPREAGLGGHQVHGRCLSFVPYPGTGFALPHMA